MEDAILGFCNRWCDIAENRKGTGMCWDCCKNTQKQDIFDYWISHQRKEGDWWISLPRCPCVLGFSKKCWGWGNKGGVSITIERVEPANPDPSVWDEPRTPPFQEESLHPGAEYSMRRKEGAGYYGTNQCIYDRDGKLITDPPTAGTVDWKRPGWMDHYRFDVEPILWANYLDGGSYHTFWGVITASVNMRRPPGPNVLKYYSVRPVWDENCAR